MKKSNLKYILIGVAVLIVILGIIYPKKSLNKQQFPANETPVEEADQIENTEQEIEEDISGEFFLQISSPQDGVTVNSSTISVSGKTKTNADVFINDLETKADDDGVFSVNLTLEEGENIIIITAGDDEGNFDEKELTVNYDVAE